MQKQNITINRSTRNSYSIFRGHIRLATIAIVLVRKQRREYIYNKIMYIQFSIFTSSIDTKLRDLQCSAIGNFSD